MDYMFVNLMLWGSRAGLPLLQPRHGAALRHREPQPRPRSGTASAPSPTASARTSTTSRACANTKRSSIRCGSRPTSPRPAAWPCRASSPTSPRSSRAGCGGCLRSRRSFCVSFRRDSRNPPRPGHARTHSKFKIESPVILHFEFCILNFYSRRRPGRSRRHAHSGRGPLASG